MNGAPDILVMGAGNILLRDEGLGVRAVERLAARHGNPGVEFLDAGTQGLELLPRLEGLASLILVDAVRSGHEPGRIVRLEGDAVPAALAVKLSVHQVGLQDLLAAARLSDCLPPRVVLWGMEPEILDWGLDLSPAIAANLEALVQCIQDELAGLESEAHLARNGGDPGNPGYRDGGSPRGGSSPGNPGFSGDR